jgi:hypothetical protein
LIEIFSARNKPGIPAAATNRTAVLIIAIVRIGSLLRLISDLVFGPEPQVYSQSPRQAIARAILLSTSHPRKKILPEPQKQGQNRMSSPKTIQLNQSKPLSRGILVTPNPLYLKQ